MINEELIEERRSILLQELQGLQERVTGLDQERTNLMANLNAVRGALQQCDYFLGIVKDDEDGHEVGQIEEGEKTDG